jgi:hypothetical protein
VVRDDRVREPAIGLFDLGEGLPNRDQLNADPGTRRRDLRQPGEGHVSGFVDQHQQWGAELAAGDIPLVGLGLEVR